MQFAGILRRSSRAPAPFVGHEREVHVGTNVTEVGGERLSTAPPVQKEFAHSFESCRVPDNSQVQRRRGEVGRGGSVANGRGSTDQFPEKSSWIFMAYQITQVWKLPGQVFDSRRSSPLSYMEH